MKASQKSYEKLPGAGFCKGSFIKFGGLSKTYLGKDHLLVVDSPSYVRESYKRIPYRDIEAIAVIRTFNFGMRLTFIIFLLALAVFAIVSGNIVVRYLAQAFSILFGILLLYELVKGPAARTIIRTRVQEAELGSCNRWRAAMKTLALLEPKILAAQGGEAETGQNRESVSSPVVAKSEEPSGREK